MKLPLVTVVMSVRDAGSKLESTLYSVLHQERINLEFIIVDDGSTDETSVLLDSIRRKDSRVRLISREGRGLTKSLVEACKIANGEFIARQDALDISLPQRLYMQATSLVKEPSASMCSTHVRFVTTEGVTAFMSCPSKSQISNNFVGVIHGSVMLRKKSYRKVGGYRSEFYYAQDVDLWSRLVEVGDHIIVPEILYESSITPGSISGSRKKEQTKFHKLIVSATKARRRGMDEKKWLEKAANYSIKCELRSNDKGDSASGAYFIGACLANKEPVLAKQYLQMAINTDPFYVKARLKLAGIK